VLATAAGCAPRPLIARAIEARGGPLTGLVTRNEARVAAGAPGIWEYTRAFLRPDRYAWTIQTSGEPLCHLFDGTLVRSFIGTAEVSIDGSPTAPLRSHARWTAVVNLDALQAPDVRLAPLPGSDRPPGVHEGLIATFPDGAEYRLGFDDRTLLVWARGTLDLFPFGYGLVTARFGERQPAGSLLLPRVADYWLDELPIAAETVLAACVDPPALTPESFTDPARLPDCR
jgi:hypothetical protein